MAYKLGRKLMKSRDFLLIDVNEQGLKIHSKSDESLALIGEVLYRMPDLKASIDAYIEDRQKEEAEAKVVKEKADNP